MGDRGFNLFTLFVYFTQLLPSVGAFFGLNDRAKK